VHGEGGVSADNVVGLKRADELARYKAAVESALALVSMAMHLHQYGEEAPGGYETWARFERDARAWIDSPAVRAVRGL
jgi:hypothetical protein